jgi:hypothetical protein
VISATLSRRIARARQSEIFLYEVPLDDYFDILTELSVSNASTFAELSPRLRELIERAESEPTVELPAVTAAGNFDESKHKRDGKGRFAKKAGGSVPKGKKLKVTHMLVHKKHAPGTIIAVDGDGQKRAVWDGNKYLLQEKQSDGGWITTSTAIKSKAYVEIGKFGDDWHEPDDNANTDPDSADSAASADATAKPKKGKTAAKSGAPGSPLKITQVLIHSKHEPGTVIAQNGANDKRVVWDGNKYRLQSVAPLENEWVTEQTVIKSKAYAAVKAFDDDWRVPPAKDAAQSPTPAPTPAAPTPVPAPAPAPAPASPANSNIKSIANYTKTGGQKGSQLGGSFTAPNGSTYYVKASKSEDHARNEVLANNLYQALGVHVPKTELVHIEGGHFPGNEGTLGTQSRMLEGSTKNLPQQLKNDPQYKAEFYENFAIDAWLGNWDVIGAGFDNVVTTFGGKPARLDQGGALLFRAQGAPKGNAFGNTVTEIDTLRNPSMNSASALAFKDITDDDIRKGVAKIEAFQPDEIDYWVDQAGFTGENATKLKSTLKARRLDLISKYGANAPKPSIAPTAPAPSTQPTQSNALGGTVKSYSSLQKAKVQSIFSKKNLKWHNKTSEIYDAALEVSTTHPDLTMADALAIMDQSLKKKSGDPFQTKVKKWLQTSAGKQHALSKGGSASIGSTSAKPVPATSTPNTASSASSSPYLSTPDDGYVDHGGKLPRKLTKDQANVLQQRMNKATPPPWTDAQRTALRRYTSGEYVNINKCARGVVDPCSDDILNVLTNIKAGMKPSTDEIVVFRKTNAASFGLSSPADMANLVGKVIEDKGVISTSIKSDQWDGDFFLEIEAPEGSMMAWVQPISYHPSEYEIVLSPGTKYEVISYAYDSNSYTGAHKVKLRIIPGSDERSQELKALQNA